MHPFRLLLECYMVLIVGIVVHEFGHYLARKVFKLSAQVVIGTGPLIFRTRNWSWRLWPISGKTIGSKHHSVVIPLAGPAMNIILASILLVKGLPLFALLSSLGAMSLIPYRWNGYPSDGLLCIQAAITQLKRT